MNIDWHIRPEKLQDIESVHAVTLAAFDTDIEANLLRNLRDDPAWIPPLSMVAENTAGEIIGHAVFTRCLIGEVPALLLGPVSVLPTHQKQGIGTAVISEAIEQAKQMGEEHLVLVGHPNYYPRFGFRRASQFGLRLAIDVPDEAFMAMTLRSDSQLPAGIVHAASCFGM